MTDQEVLPAAGREELGARAVSGARWLVAGQGVTEVVALASTIALARLVSPTEYGYAAAAIIFPTLAEVLLYEGFGLSLVRRADATRKDAGVAMTLSLALGFALFLLVEAGAWLASPLLVDAEQSLFQLAAVAFLLSAPNVVPQALQQRQMAFRVIASREATALVIGSASAVGLALAGLGGAAVIGGLLVRRLAVTVLLALATERVRPRWDRRIAREAIGFGSLSSLAGVMVLAKKNIDYFILAFFMQPRDLGLYYRAYSIGVDYQGKVSTVATRMALPLYSRAGDLADMWALRRRFARIQMAVVTPVLATFVATASQVVPVVFGSRWTGAVVPAQILVAVPLIGLIGAGTGPLLMAAGRPGAVAASNGASLVLYAITVAFAATQDLVTLCLIVVAFNAAFTWASAYLLIDRILGFNPLPLIGELATAVAAALPTFALAFVVDDLEPSFITMVWLVVATALWCLLSYSAIMRVVFPGTWHDVTPIIRRFVRIPSWRRAR